MTTTRIGSSGQVDGHWPRLSKLCLIAFLCLILLGFDLWLVASREKSKSSDFFQFWAAGRAILQRDDPYEPQAWRGIYHEHGRWRCHTDQPVFVYPLWTAFPFVPLALLPVSWASLVWIATSQLLVMLSAVLMVKALYWSGPEHWLPLIAIIAIAFEPVALTILFGQLGILLLVLVCAVLYLISHGRHASAGVVLALTLLKPQLFAAVIPAVLWVMLLRRRWAFAATFIITAMMLVISSWLLVPQWVSRWQDQLVQTAPIRLTISPTIWGISHSIVTALGRPDLWGAMSVSACLVLVGLVSYIWYQTKNAFSEDEQMASLLSVTMIVSLVASPYLLSYDFALLLLPVVTCLWLVQPLPGRVRRTAVATVAGCAIVMPWALLVIAARTGKETTAVLLPASVLAMLLAARLARRHCPASTASTWLAKD